MQVIVKNNKVIATYGNDVDTAGLHEGSRSYLFPDGFKYAEPITDMVMDMGEMVAFDRYDIKVGDPSPISNTTNIPNINLRKQYLAEQASKECQERIEYKDGETRYQTIKQNSFTDILMYCKDWLADNPSATEEEKAPYETRIARINSFRVWMRTVLNYFYTIQGQIVAADEEGLAALTWDYAQFEATDPEVTLEEVRI